MECGAFDGVTESSCKYFEESLGWQAINVEASPAIFAQLVKNRPHSLNLNLALSDRCQLTEFVEVKHPGFELCTNGSLKHLDEHLEWLRSEQCTFSRSFVQTCTYRELIENLQVSDIDLMVLDVEGHELAAISGFFGASVLPKVLCVEHGHLGVPKICEAVEPLGYRFDIQSHVNSYFVRRET